MEIYPIYGFKGEILPVSELLKAWSDHLKVPTLTPKTLTRLTPTYARNLISLFRLKITTEGNPFFIKVIESFGKFLRQQSKTPASMYYSYLITYSHLADLLVPLIVLFKKDTFTLTDALLPKIREKPTIRENVFKALIKAAMNSTNTSEQHKYVIELANDSLEKYLPKACLAQSLLDCGECTMNLDKLELLTCIAICNSSRSRCKRLASKDKWYCTQHYNRQQTIKRARIVENKYVELSPLPVKDVTKKTYNERGGIYFHQNTERVGNPMKNLLKAPLGSKVPDGLYMPVYRIEYLYHAKNEEKYCGKFYFYEPDSKVQLSLGTKVGFFAGKIHAYMKLLKEYSTRQKNNTIKFEEYKIINPKALTRDHLPIWEINDVPKEETIAMTSNLKGLYSPLVTSLITSFEPSVQDLKDNDIQEYFFKILLSRKNMQLWTYECETCSYKSKNTKEFRKHTKTNRHVGRNFISNTSWLHPLFPSFNPEEHFVYIGQLDGLDQLICRLANFLGYHTIIFQHEVGGKDAVTEILDVRDNAEFYSNVHYIPDVLKNKTRKYDNHIIGHFPKVFFPKDSFITRVKNNIASHVPLPKSTITIWDQEPFF